MASLRDVAFMSGNVLQIDEICGIRALELSGACSINLFRSDLGIAQIFWETYVG